MKLSLKSCHSWRAWRAVLAALALLLAALPLSASPTAEDHAWIAAVHYFQDASGPTLWSLAEGKFAAFIEKYSNSEHYADAVVYEARAMYEQRKYDAVIALLSAQPERAGAAADQFAYWTAKAWSQKKNYEKAAEVFARLIRENPNSSLRLEAIYREAEAHAILQYWPRVIEELGETNGIF
ncbi:MAG TPA: tetratricopeptide repeat protein, partial [Verrucomicrobiae bacterium]|nr:tetratricopeptide repeat protein [Verrucomicrobiae bacterium]